MAKLENRVTQMWPKATLGSVVHSSNDLGLEIIENGKLGNSCQPVRPNDRVLSAQNELRQIARRSNELTQKIVSLKKFIEKPNKKQLFFYSPLQDSIENKRWEEFSTFAKRSIFILKIKINNSDLLEVFQTTSSFTTKEHGALLRTLASICRTSLYILKGFERFPNEIRTGKSGGLVLLNEALALAEEILFLISELDPSILPPNYVAKFQKMATTSPEVSEDVSENTINISTSDWNSEAEQIFDPQRIKKKLSKLAKIKLPVARSKAKRPKKIYKIIQPLKVNQKKLSSKEVLVEQKTLKKMETKKNKSKRSKPRENIKRKQIFCANPPTDRLTALNKISFEDPPTTANMNYIVNEDFLSEYVQKLDVLDQRLLLEEKELVRRKSCLEEMSKIVGSSWTELDNPFDLDGAIREANLSIDRVHRDLNPEYLVIKDTNKIQEAFAVKLISNDNHHKAESQEQPTMHQQIVEQIEKFWSDMVKRNFIVNERKTENNAMQERKEEDVRSMNKETKIIKEKKEVTKEKKEVIKENKCTQVQFSLQDNEHQEVATPDNHQNISVQSEESLQQNAKVSVSSHGSEPMISEESRVNDESKREISVTLPDESISESIHQEISKEFISESYRYSSDFSETSTK